MFVPHLYILFYSFSTSEPTKFRTTNTPFSQRYSTFYARWNALKARHRWTCGRCMRRHLQKSETYLAIGLTYTDYGRSKLEYGAYPLIVGVHVVP